MVEPWFQNPKQKEDPVVLASWCLQVVLEGLTTPASLLPPSPASPCSSHAPQGHGNLAWLMGSSWPCNSVPSIYLHCWGTGWGFLLPLPRNSLPGGFTSSTRCSPADLEGALLTPPLSVSSNTNYLSLDILFCFLLLSKLWEFSNRFKSFGKQSILLWGREYIPDFLFEGWMQRRKTEWRKSPLISPNITQPQLSAIHC